MPVKPIERILLPIFGVLLFLGLWQGMILATRPDLVRRPTLGAAALSGGAAAVVIVDGQGGVVLQERLAMTPASEATAQLAGWLKTWQPNLAALAAGEPALAQLVNEANADFGGSLETAQFDPTADTPFEAALAGARQLQATRALRPAWLPDPLEAATAFVDMVRSGELLRHAVASLWRVGAGFCLAAVAGVGLGVGLGRFARLSLLCNAVIQGLRPISPIAWLPAATLALGGGDLAAIFLIFMAAFLPTTVATAAAIGNVELRYRRSGANFGLNEWAMTWHVLLPASLPAILTALRIALGVAWVVVVAAEMLGVEAGLGYLVLDARNQLRYDRVVAAMIAIGIIGLGLDAGVAQYERAERERRGLKAG